MFLILEVFVFELFYKQEIIIVSKLLQENNKPSWLLLILDLSFKIISFASRLLYCLNVLCSIFIVHM